MRRSCLSRGLTSTRARSAGLALVALVATLSRLACSGSSTIGDRGRRDAGADTSAAADHDGSDGLDAGAEADGFWNYDQPVQTDAWCAPPHKPSERAACCNDAPCYGNCARHRPDGSIICECFTVIGGCRNGTKCCISAGGCIAADAGCPAPP